MKFDAVYYEPAALEYPMGKMLKGKFCGLEWIPIESHNRIPQMQQRPNKDFPLLKRALIVGVRKTHKYTENHKISDYLVPFTSSGCSAMCLYCYLVCNFNKCSYLRLFVNREQMLDRLCDFSKKTPEPMTYEIGSNSDLLLENEATGNLEWVIPAFAQRGRGRLTFPTKFADVGTLLELPHEGKTIFRMSVNPPEIIRRVELGTAPLEKRVRALCRMHEAGYPCGILIAPVILSEGWEAQYTQLVEYLSDTLPAKVRGSITVEIIFMTYSAIHRAINTQAFPNAPDLFDAALMAGRGRGKYAYTGQPRAQAEELLREHIGRKLPGARIVYVC